MTEYRLAAGVAWQTKVVKSVQSGKVRHQPKGSTQKSAACRTGIVLGVSGMAQGVKRVLTRDVLMAVAARWQISWEGSVQEVQALKAGRSLLHTCRDDVPDLDIIWQHFTGAQALLPAAILQYAHWRLSAECTTCS